MGWSIGYDEIWSRDVGYGVPAICDHPECNTAIDRGLSYVCGGEPFGGENGCGLFFCPEHGGGSRCERCSEDITDEDIEHAIEDCESGIDFDAAVELLDALGVDRFGSEPFPPKPDTAEWVHHKLTDPSWQQWREENPAEVARLTGIGA
jgi:hypothetical protein